VNQIFSGFPGSGLLAAVPPTSRNFLTVVKLLILGEITALVNADGLTNF
jgi:hypothetical protein